MAGTVPNLFSTQTGPIPLSQLDANFAYVNAKVISVEDYGTAGNGVADDTAAIQAAINAMPSSGGILYFPAGTFKTSSTITISTSNVTLQGQGSSTIIASSTGSSDIFQLTGNWYRIDGFFFAGTTTFTGGYGFNFLGNSGNISISNIWFTNGWNGIGFNGTNQGQVFITSCLFDNLLQNGVVFNNSFGGLAFMSNCRGGTSQSNSANGIFIGNGDTFHFANVDMTGYFINIQVKPGTSGFVRNLHCVNCTFDGAGRTSSGQPSIILDGSNSGADLSRVRFVNCWGSSQKGSHGCFINASNDVSIENSTFINNDGHGILVTGGSQGIRIVNCTVAGNSVTTTNTNDGINIASGVNHFFISLVDTQGIGSFVATSQRYGVNIVGTSNDHYVVANNILTGNLTGAFNNGGTGAHTIVSPNLTA